MKIALVIIALALVAALCFGTTSAAYGSNVGTPTTTALDRANTTPSGSSNSAVTPSAASTAAISSCVVTESIQSEINDLMGKLQAAEKNNDMQLMNEIKQKISLLGEEFDKQRESCQARVDAVPIPATSATGAGNSGTNVTPTKVQPPTPAGAQSTTTITSTCIDESVASRWNELASQLETAVANNDTETASQLGPELESLGQEVLDQIIGKCSSNTGGVPSVKLFCPVEAVMYASLEKQLYPLQAQEYQARTAGNTELAIQLQAQIESLNAEAAKYTEKCQAKLLVSDTAKYFMSTPLKAGSPTGTTQPAVRNVEEGVIYSTPTAQEATTASVCYIPYELETRLKEAWNEYNSLVQGMDANGSIDMEKMRQVKEAISSTEAEINKIKQNCQPNVTCPLISQPAPDFKERCTAGNGTIVEKIDNNGCVAGYKCGTSAAPGQIIRPGENCTVPVELTQEFEGLWKNYKEAVSNNDTEKAASIKQKISEIEQKLSSTKGQCMKTIVSDRAETRDVTGYYRQKVTEVLSQESDTDSQIEQLKSLRDEIDNMIIGLLNKKKQLNASEVSGVIDEIKVKKNSIQAGNATMATTEASIMTRISDKDIGVKPSATGVEITEGNITITSTELSIRNNKVEMGNKIINIAPSAVAGKANMQNTKALNLSVEDGNPVYDIKGDENRKLLWVIPVAMEKQVRVDASTGDVIKEDKPWWSALTSD